MWKIADFGLSRTGTSQIQTTVHSAGTTGYRAPELLADSKRTFTNKADIWALGCVLYRLVSGKMAFQHDWAAYQWALSKEPLHFFDREIYKFSTPSPGNVFLQSVITAMLMPESTRRPTAAGLFAVFNQAYNFFSPGGAALPSKNELNVFLGGVL